jgi:DNA-binding MarR family transcriptional regulator
MNKKIITDVQELNDIEYACQAMLTREYEGMLDETVTSSQIIILNHLHDNERLLTGELAKLMEISPSAVSQMLNKMEKRKLVRRFMNPENRREIFVEMDIAGTDYIETSQKIELSIIERFYSKLSPADLKELGRIMKKFKKIIEVELANKTSEQNI